MEWSNETVLEFLECYENEPVIWNAVLPNHKVRNGVYDDAWKRIQDKMGGKYSVSELKKKKQSLMASFRVCLNKVKQSVKSGAGSDEVFKPQYQKMASFLRDKDLPRTTMNSEDILLEEGGENDDKESIADGILENEELELENIENAALVLPSCSRSASKPLSQKERKVVETQELKNKMDNAYALLQAASNKLVKDRNVCTIYGELVAAKLQLMDEQTREICMNRIDNILFEMKMNSSMQFSSNHQVYPNSEYNPIYSYSSPSSSSRSSIMSNNTLSHQMRHQTSQYHSCTNPTTPHTLTSLNVVTPPPPLENLCTKPQSLTNIDTYFE